MHILEVAHDCASSSVHVCVASLGRRGLRVVGEGEMGGIHVGLRQDTVNARIEAYRSTGRMGYGGGVHAI